MDEIEFDANVDRLKACEHIADGDEGWEALRNECPSTAAVARLRDALEAAADRERRMREALERIRDHWANQYDHPRKESEMYRGSYGIGVTDGHRACAAIARAALADGQPGEMP
jgi:hypothetical protein